MYIKLNIVYIPKTNDKYVLKKFDQRLRRKLFERIKLFDKVATFPPIFQKSC